VKPQSLVTRAYSITKCLIFYQKLFGVVLCPEPQAEVPYAPLELLGDLNRRNPSLTVYCACVVGTIGLAMPYFRRICCLVPISYRKFHSPASDFFCRSEKARQLLDFEYPLSRLTFLILKLIHA